MKYISRRTSILSLATASGLVGVGYSWYQHRLGKPADQVLETLWNLEFELPRGNTLKFKTLVGAPIVLNFWATWCPPCVEELPLLERFYQQNISKRWQVIGLAVDNTRAVNQFLNKMPVSFPTPLAGLEGIELSHSLGNLSGGLPFTVVFNSAGEIVVRHMGKLNSQQLDGFSLIR
jgi:thiol-disulfide isomerase/thioredoxin